MSKKGSISLSINMIVVVVLAFVMLGLMLGLGTDIISSASETSSQVSEQTKQDIINKLTQSDEPLYFSQREFNVPFKKKETITFGVSNVDPTSANLKIQIFKINDDGGDSELSSSKNPSVETGGSFFWAKSDQKYTAGESKVFDVQYYAPSAKDTFMFKFKLVDQASGESVAEQIVFINVI